MVVQKANWKKPVYGPKFLVFEWSAKSHDFTIWIPDAHTIQYSGVRYSDGYCTIFSFDFVSDLGKIVAAKENFFLRKTRNFWPKKSFPDETNQSCTWGKQQFHSKINFGYFVALVLIPLRANNSGSSKFNWEKKSAHPRTWYQRICLSVCLSVNNFDPNISRLAQQNRLNILSCAQHHHQN